MHSFVHAGAQTFQSSKLRVVPALTILNTKLVGRYARCDCRSCDITYGDMYGTRRKYCRLERDKTRDIASPLAIRRMRIVEDIGKNKPRARGWVGLSLSPNL